MLKLSDIMTREVVTLTPQTTLREAIELFAARHISGAPVICGDTVVGVMSAADVLAFAASTSDDGAGGPEFQGSIDGSGDDDYECENVALGSYFTDLWDDVGLDTTDRMNPLHGAEWRLLEEHTVDEVMTRSAVTLEPNDSVLDAAAAMQSRSIHRVVVLEHGRLVGIVSALDVVRAAAEHMLRIAGDSRTDVARLA